MTPLFRTLGLAILTLIGLQGAALADKRVALVIGNGAYVNAPALPNPPRDAHAMADKLKALGFQVVEGYDLDKQGMSALVQRFARAVSGADVGLFYYAGHGMQVNSENYIVPVDAKLEDALSVDFEITKVGFVIDQMSRDVKLKIALLDACRDNPLSRSLAARSRSIAVVSGMADMKVVNQAASEGSLIAFATDPGNVALDGNGDHSPFTQALLENIGGNASLSSVMNRVTSAVLKLTDNRQRPWVQASLTGDVFLNPAAQTVATDAAPAPSVPAALAPVPAAQPDDAVALGRENALWAAVKQSNTVEDYQSYIDTYPSGLYVALARNAIQRSKQAMLAPPAGGIVPTQGPVPAPPEVAQAASSAETEAGLDLDQAAQKAIQQRLKLAGFDPSAANGNFGAKTRIAIGKWQTARGIPGTGYFNKPQYDFLLAETNVAYAALQKTMAAVPPAPKKPKVKVVRQQPIQPDGPPRVVRRRPPPQDEQVVDRQRPPPSDTSGRDAFMGAVGGALIGGALSGAFNH
ncbi:caspase family protein [Labrys wisconsinensis]|uniref:Caspase family p20 domain-containing protein n=1 Tax=Labrys wisconsinensis TaxID=425677 RepID=A0ABU0IZF6_9HYPH|nr:caspase family protein [Labrys wisconsinensis]MDQ0467397.1 hypothetical protein [Labrys wisconsinensis]